MQAKREKKTAIVLYPRSSMFLFSTSLFIYLFINYEGVIMCDSSLEGNHRILVYEYLENNSLASALLGNNQIIGVLYGIN